MLCTSCTFILTNMFNRRIALFILLAAGFLLPVSAQAQESRPLYIIFDGSNSMWGELPDKSRKIGVAKEVFNNLDPSLFADRDVALRLYGHRRSGDCSDIELAVPLQPAAQAVTQMADHINGVTPRGKTPITRSLTAAMDDLGGRAGDILLISDGIETCDADPCDLVHSWREEGTTVRVHVVGLGLTEEARGAMQCIAEASGTEYRDAESAKDLSEAIVTTATSEPPQPGEANPRPQTEGYDFSLRGLDAEGNFVPVKGTLTAADGSVIEVQSNFRFVIEPGTYTLEAGVPTVNGVLYETRSKEVEVLEAGRTAVSIEVPRPPQVTTQFISEGEEVRGAGVTAYQSGHEQFFLRPRDEYYILPGTYDFTAQLNEDNKLKITETIVAGEDKVLVFEAVKTVRIRFVVRPEEQDAIVRVHQELLQDGEVKYWLHHGNGGPVRPGVYTLRNADPHALTPYEIPDIEITGDDDQQLRELTIPVGTAQITYRFSGEPPSDDLRCWISRLDTDGNTIVQSRAKQCDGRTIPMVAGQFQVEVWSRLGTFKTTPFTVKNNELTVVDLREE